MSLDTWSTMTIQIANNIRNIGNFATYDSDMKYFSYQNDIEIT